MKKIIFSTLFLVFSINGFCQNTVGDTSKLTLENTEKIFLANNLDLLAGKFGIQGAQALIRQSKLWDNPTVYLEQNIFNPANRRFFDMSNNGEYIAQIQQL